MEYHSVIKSNDFMKFADKWIELENIILSEVTQTQKKMHVLCSSVDISHKVQDTHAILHRPKEAKHQARMLKFHLEGGIK